MSVYAGPEIVSSNLVFYIDFANPKSISGNTVTDLCSRKIPVTLTNASNNTLIIANNYATFSPESEGTQSTYYRIANTYFNEIRNEMTIEACVWPVSFPVGGNRIVSPRVTESGQPIGFNIGATTIGIEVNSSGTWRTFNYGVGSTANSWLHLTQTTSNTNNVMITYLNGRKLGEINIPGTLANGGGFLIGLGFYGGVKYSGARISYLKVYDKVLTQEEIQQNFNSVRGRFGI